MACNIIYWAAKIFILIDYSELDINVIQGERERDRGRI